MKNLYAKIAQYHKKGVKLEKDKQNPYFKSMYMSLDNIVNTITPVLNEVGLVITHHVSNQDGKSYVITTIADPETAECFASSFPINGTDPQKVGSEISYGKRYNTSCLLNIVDSEDDDGNSATDDINSKPKTQEPTEWIDRKKIDDLISKISTGEVIASSGDEAIKIARTYYKVSKENAELIKSEYSKHIL